MRIRPITFFAFLCVLVLVVPTPSPAALFNNVRVDRFKWMKAQTEHFDIYYDKKVEKMVPRLALYLEKAWQDVGDKLQFPVKERTPFFFYSNHNEFEQSNIVRIGEGTGGVTEAFKNRFLIFNDGSETWLKHVIYHEFAHVVQFNILYGGFWKSIRLLKSPFYPLWVMEGIAEWTTEPIDATLTDMMIRDSVYYGYRVPLPELQGFNHLKPNQITLAYKTGTKAMAFLADEYGPNTVANLLVKMESFFDISSALHNLIGIDLTRLDYRFGEWLQDLYDPFFNKAKSASHYGTQLTFSDGIPQFHHAPVFSKDGTKMFLFSDRSGGNGPYVYDIAEKKLKGLKGLDGSKIENLHAKGRALSVSADGRWLAFAGEKKQRDFLYLVDLEKKKMKKIKPPFDQIRYPVFSPVTNDIAVVGMIDGYNDIFLIDMKGKLKKRITNNPQDERGLVFRKDGKSLIYSGEVFNKEGTDPVGRDLFSVSLENPVPTRLTYLSGSVSEPEILPDGSVVFVRSQNDQGELGFNLYHYDVSFSSLTQLTEFIGGGFAPRYHPQEKALYFIAFDNGERHVYKGNDVLQKDIALALNPPKEKEQSDVASTEGDEWGDPPERPGGHDFTRSFHVWPNSYDSSLLLRTARPYKFKMSTDLFLPFFFYSTQDGLVVADVWQFSDYLGDHTFQQQMQYASKNDFVDLTLFYTYSHFRPQMTMGFRTQRFFEDFDEQNVRRRIDGVGLVTYPVNRVTSVFAGVGATDEKNIFLDQSDLDTQTRQRFWIVGYTRDTVSGRYLVPTRGRRLSLFYKQANKTVGGDQQYKTGGAEAVRYFRLPRESAVATRLFYARSTGSEPQIYRLGGVDRIRAVNRSGEAHKKQNIVLGSGELRFRMKYLNARTKFLFPDFFFKAAYLILFDDVGFGWDNRQERRDFDRGELINSAGVGISWPTFILQSFQINLTVQWAKRTDNGSEVWYVTLGPSY